MCARTVGCLQAPSRSGMPVPPRPRLKQAAGSPLLALLVPWLVLLVTIGALLLLSLVISGQVLMYGDLSGVFSLRASRSGEGGLAISWAEFDRSGGDAGQHVVASIERFWGRNEAGASTWSAALHVGYGVELALPRDAVFLTLLGYASWLPGGRGAAWTPIGPYSDSLDSAPSPHIHFRTLPCPAVGEDLAPGPLSGPERQGAHVVVLGQCAQDRPRGELGRPYFEAERAAQRAEAIRRVHRTAGTPIPVIAHALPPPPLLIATQAGTANDSAAEARAWEHRRSPNPNRAWEHRRSDWWGWEVLSGRQRGAGGLAAALSPATEAEQLQAFLAARLARDCAVLPVWPRGPAGEEGVDPLRLLLAQIRFLHDKGALLSGAPAAAPATALPLSLLCAPLLLTRKHHPDCLPPLPPPHATLPLLVTSLGGAGTHGAAKSLQRLGATVQHEGLGSGGAVAWMYAVNDAALGTQYPFRALLPPRTRGLLSPRFARVVHLTRHPLRHASSFAAHLPAAHSFVRFAAEGLAGDLAPMLAAWAELPERGTGAGAVAARLASLTRLHALAAAISALPRPPPPGPLFPALAWLLWDALADMQADARLRVEGAGEGGETLEQALRALAQQAGGGADAEGQEAGLVRWLLSSLYGAYNLLAGTSKPLDKRIHSAHVELSWADLEALPPCRSPGHADVRVLEQVRDRAALYGYHEG